MLPLGKWHENEIVSDKVKRIGAGLGPVHSVGTVSTRSTLEDKRVGGVVHAHIQIAVCPFGDRVDGRCSTKTAALTRCQKH